ncbi:MAG TPA: BadF/BadG/BcrA/BcrD ATPase family protein [Thermomicrobiales bacterium]|nr:BadF/BadG/BcrA/BcrD ATPase family protein [Thermomicrobiales bacterium]
MGTDGSRPAALIAGLDGGGTKTVCLLARADDGTVLGRETGGPSNMHAVGQERVRESLREAVAGAFAAAGLAPGPVAAAVLGSAGADRPDDRAAMVELLKAAVDAPRYIVVNDGAIALRAAVPAGPGVLIVAGTGTIGYGRDAAGREHRAGGWGYLLDDVGSAYKVGLDGLTALLRAYDGRGAPTALSDTLLAPLGLAAPENLIGYVYRLPPPRVEIAQLAPLVVASARDGDAVAGAIVAAAGDALGELAVAVLRKIAPGAPAGEALPVVTDGGFVRSAADLLVPRLLAAVREAGFAIAHRLATVEAAHGALLLARDALPGGEGGGGG